MTSDAWLRLLIAAGYGGRRWIRALRRAGSAEAMRSMGRAALRRCGLDSEQIARFERAPDTPPALWSAWLESSNHHLIAYGTRHYPPRLAELDDAPLALWIDGLDISLLGHPQLAIVGSRHPTANGRATAESFAAELSHSGITITSGLALGIDAASHRGALSGVGRTIAVLGNGIDQNYPPRNHKLATEIRADGLVVSEYPPATPVRAHRFPQRNRIIAGLSLGTLVVEATRRSGSLITARIAADSGRDVFAVPGSIHSPLSKGCHKLICDGAKLVEDIGDILVEIAPELRAAARPSAVPDEAGNITDLPGALAEHLHYSPVTFDSLASDTGLTAAELSSMLLHLEIQGKIEALPGGRYCRLAKRG